MKLSNQFQSQSTFDVLVLDAQTRQSLVTIRSLGRKGLRIAAMAVQGENVPSFSSKWCNLALFVSAKEGSDEYATFLLDFLKQNSVKVVITSLDGTIDLLRKYRKKIIHYTSIALASEKSLSIAINKEKTLAIAEKLGIRIPKSYKVAKKSDIPQALKQLRLPIVIKPIESWTANKKGTKRVAPLLAITKEEAYIAFNELNECGGETLFQEYLTGLREAVSVIYSHKKFYATFAQVALRTQPPLGGTSVLRKSIALPKDVGKQAEDLIRKINLEGYSEIEFRRDEAGTPFLMEINARLSMSVDVAVQSGCDFPYLLYVWAYGKNKLPKSSYTPNIWERYLAGDLINLVESIKQSGRPGIPAPWKVVRDFIISFLSPMKYDYIDFEDINPTINATIDSIVRNIKKLL